MAEPRGSRRAAGATLETCLGEARAGKARPVYLFDGDAFLALRAARELAGALVPEAQRALNLVELDVAASPSEVAAEISTGGLFAGGKVVLVQEPAFLSSKEDAAESFERARRMWADGRRREAARRLLALAAKAGLSAGDLAPGEGDPGAAPALGRELGIDLDGIAGAADFVAGAARFALEHDMKVAKNDASDLDAAIARGFPPGHVLVIAAGKVDGRLPLVKKLAAAGRRVSLVIEKEGQWGEQRLVLGPVLESLLAGTGKRVDRAGEARLAELVGEDARTLAQETAKLAAYVGDLEVITAADVDQVVTRVAADPFFALGNAVGGRDLEAALGVLDRSVAGGASPFMILGSLASTLRRLLVERERARKAAGDRRIRSFAEWQDAVLPGIPADEIGEKKPYGFWMKYQAAARFERGELIAALAALADADVAMKSGQDGRIRIERVLLGLLGGPRRERNTA